MTKVIKYEDFKEKIEKRESFLGSKNWNRGYYGTIFTKYGIVSVHTWSGWKEHEHTTLQIIIKGYHYVRRYSKALADRSVAKKAELFAKEVAELS